MDDVKQEYRKAYEDWQEHLSGLHRVLLDRERLEPPKLKALLNREARAKNATTPPAAAYSVFPTSTSALLMKPTRISSFAPHVLQMNHACGYVDTEIGRRRRA
jgi:hypothetical protein